MIKRKASKIKEELLSGRNYSFSYVLGEVLEVFEALLKLDFAEALTELRQVWYGLQMQFFQLTGVDFYLTGCEDVVQSFYDRRIVWRMIFDSLDREFKNKYLVNGSNWERPHKIVAALGLAGVTINAEMAERMVKWLKARKLSSSTVRKP